MVFHSFFFFFPFCPLTVISLFLFLFLLLISLYCSLYAQSICCFFLPPTFFLCLVFSFLSTLFPDSFILFTQLLILFSRFTQFGSILCVSFQMQTFYMLHFQLLADYSEIFKSNNPQKIFSPYTFFFSF